MATTIRVVMYGEDTRKNVMYRRCALLGRGITYSLSACMHHQAAQICGIDGFHYEVLDIPEQALSQLPRLLEHNNIHAINITQPYKQKIARVLSASPLFVHHPNAWKTTAYNLALQSKDGIWQCTNTDGIGFFEAMIVLKMPMQSVKHMVFLGFGGAVIGVLEALCDPRHPYASYFSGLEEVHIFARQFDKDYGVHSPQDMPQLASCVRHPFSQVTTYPFQIAHWNKCLREHKGCMWIQATPLPHQGDLMERFATVFKELPWDCVIAGCDMNYAPSSQLLAYAEEQNIVCMHGIDMLVAQAIVCHRLWWNQAPSFESLRSYVMQRQHLG